MCIRDRAEVTPRTLSLNNIASAYVTNLEILPETYSSVEAALKRTEIPASCETFQGSGSTDSAQKSGSTEGVPAEKCCIALDENTNRLWVMLQASDASSVEYRNLGHKDRTLFDKSRYTEVNNLLDLGAYRILSLGESLKFRAEFPDYVCRHDLSIVGKLQMKVERKRRAGL